VRVGPWAGREHWDSHAQSDERGRALRSARPRAARHRRTFARWSPCGRAPGSQVAI